MHSDSTARPGGCEANTRNAASPSNGASWKAFCGGYGSGSTANCAYGGTGCFPRCAACTTMEPSSCPDAGIVSRASPGRCMPSARSVGDTVPGRYLLTRLADGTLRSRVSSVTPAPLASEEDPA